MSGNSQRKAPPVGLISKFASLPHALVLLLRCYAAPSAKFSLSADSLAFSSSPRYHLQSGSSNFKVITSSPPFQIGSARCTIWLHLSCPAPLWMTCCSLTSLLRSQNRHRVNWKFSLLAAVVRGEIAEKKEGESDRSGGGSSGVLESASPLSYLITRRKVLQLLLELVSGR